MGAIILKIVRTLRIISDFIFKVDAEDKGKIIVTVSLLIFLTIFLPVLFVQYVFEHPIEALLLVLDGSARNFAEDIKNGIKGDDGEIIFPLDIPPSDIAPMGEEAFNSLMAEATKYIGRPYVWGGSSPSTGFDCSGYICWVYSKSGVYNMPRTTAQGIYNNYVSPINKSEAKAGDIVFFTKTYKTSSTVTHVAIYLGADTFLHCGDPIGYASLTTPYWQEHYYGFGRIR